MALFVGNLPANLSQKNYETIILEYLDEGSKFTSIGPIYYEYGSMLITFDNSDSAVQAYELLRVALYEDKKLLGERLAVALSRPFNILKFKFLPMCSNHQNSKISTRKFSKISCNLISNI